jgi:hypothetical protein
MEAEELLEWRQRSFWGEGREEEGRVEREGDGRRERGTNEEGMGTWVWTKVVHGVEEGRPVEALEHVLDEGRVVVARADHDRRGVDSERVRHLRASDGWETQTARRRGPPAGRATGVIAWIPLTGEMRMLCVNRRSPPRSLSEAAGRIGVSGLPPDKRIGDSCSDEDLGFPFPERRCRKLVS